MSTWADKLELVERTYQNGECSDKSCRRQIRVGEQYYQTKGQPHWVMCDICAKKIGLECPKNIQVR